MESVELEVLDATVVLAIVNRVSVRINLQKWQL